MDVVEAAVRVIEQMIVCLFFNVKRRMSPERKSTCEALPDTIGEVLVGAIQAQGTITSRLDGRLTIHGTPARRKPV